MIASLSMYDWPETHAALQVFWGRIQSHLKPVCANVPLQLTHSELQQQWQSRNLLLSQTCGYPLVTVLPADSVVVGTLEYDVDAMENGYYASMLIVNKNDTRSHITEFQHSTLAYNSEDSQSGFNCVRNILAETPETNASRNGFFSRGVRTGSHRDSIKCVANGHADICAVDPVSWALAKRHEGACSQVAVFGHTRYSPALPLVSSPHSIPVHMSHDQWRSAVQNAVNATINANTRQELFLKGITYIEKEQYLKEPITDDRIVQNSNK